MKNPPLLSIRRSDCSPHWLTNVDSQGIEGVEKSFDKWLPPGERIVRKDRYGRVIEDISSTDSRAAHGGAEY